MSRSRNVWDNAAAESFFSSLKTERVRRKIYRTRDQARADVFDYIKRFYNPTRTSPDHRISEPYAMRGESDESLNCRPRNRQQLTLPCAAIDRCIGELDRSQSRHRPQAGGISRKGD